LPARRSKPVRQLYIGLMSGTSMDAIDAALIDVADDIKLLATCSHSWPVELRQRLRAAASGRHLQAAELAQLDALCGEEFARAALQLLAVSGHDTSQIRAIGSHGQTLAHDPAMDPPYSLQIGDASRIAERTGITTVADFRSRDIAAGGEGAPLTPAFHQAMAGTPTGQIVVLNIGGIANLTLLQPGKPTRGFDTGPGNCLMDGWIGLQRSLDFDHDGSWAASGRIIDSLLEAMLADPYFQRQTPKTTGTQYFSERWLLGHLERLPQWAAEDVQATLLALTSEGIARALRQMAVRPQCIYLCGGGAHNRVLRQDLHQRTGVPVETTAGLGVDPDWVEAAAFAWLAHRCLEGLPGNLPEVTGARNPVVLGAIHQA